MNMKQAFPNLKFNNKVFEETELTVEQLKYLESIKMKGQKAGQRFSTMFK